MTRHTASGSSDAEVCGALADAWDREPDTVWTPPGLPTFEPGQRVMVRVNLECRYCLDPRFPKCYERALADDGRTATVYDVGHGGCSCRWDDEPAGADHMGHPVWVTWDERREYDDPVLEGVGFDAHFAAAELIPLADDQARARPDAAGEAEQHG